jgi:hypothetical protein
MNASTHTTSLTNTADPDLAEQVTGAAICGAVVGPVGVVQKYHMLALADLK